MGTSISGKRVVIGLAIALAASVGVAGHLQQQGQIERLRAEVSSLRHGQQAVASQALARAPRYVEDAAAELRAKGQDCYVEKHPTLHWVVACR